MARGKVAERTRGRHFPEDYNLERLLRTFDPAIGPFKIEMFRRNARDLRKWLEGPSAFYDVPPDQGLRRAELPRGWEVIYRYHPTFELEPAEVTAFFRQTPEEEQSQDEPSSPAAEVHAENTPAEQNAGSGQIMPQPQPELSQP